jgi:hypothetical protein
MQCDVALMDVRYAGPAAEQAQRHIDGCDDCRAALRSASALALDRRTSPPPPTAGAFERAMARAARQPRSVAPRRGFWLGTAVGAALAAGLAVAIVVMWVRPEVSAPAANPQVQLALNEVRAVSLSLDSPEALADAEIHVVLTGAVALEGFAGQHELRWMTDLARGVNQLTLPLIAIGPNGGQVMVEVQHGDKRRAFVVDVQTVDAAVRGSHVVPPPAGTPAAA